MVRMLATFGASLAAYMLLAGTSSASEFATGLVISAIATTWATIVRRASPRRFSFSGGHLRTWVRASRTVPGATLLTARALAGAILRSHDQASRADERPFRHGRAAAGAEHGRRATAVLAASLAPASFVVGIEGDRDRALVHTIGQARGPDNQDWLA